MEPGERAIKKIRRVLGLSFLFCLGVFAVGLAVVYYSYKQLPEVPNLSKCYQVSVSSKKHCPFGIEHTKLSSLQDHTKWAFVLAEDASFFGHKGVDWFEVKESFKKNIKTKKFSRGGSTISQQMIKNLLLSNEKTLIRKIKELFITQRLEEKYSKEIILETYLNIIEFGEDLYGITEASRKYFGKTPSSLNIQESLFLATLLPSPVRYQKALENNEIDSRQLDLMVSVAGRLKRFKKVDEETIDLITENLNYQNLFISQETLVGPTLERKKDATSDSSENSNPLSTTSSEMNEEDFSREESTQPFGSSDDSEILNDDSTSEPGNS